MAPTTAVQPVKRLLAALTSNDAALARALEILIAEWGPIDFTGRGHSFDVTDYYATEMGTGLQRRLFAFEQLMPPDALADAKLRCNQLEEKLAREHRRSVNLDVGYLDHNKIVLASVKYAGQKIYLRDGIYADLVARYKRGRFEPLEWTFPDFRDGRYDPELAAVRSRYLQQLREQCP